MSKLRVAAVSEIGEGRLLRVDADGRALIITRTNGRFGAIEAICSHAGGRLEDGEIENGCVVCPVHGAIFDLISGKVSRETGWATDLQAFTLTVEGDDLLLEIAERERDLRGAQAIQTGPSAAGADAAGCPLSSAARGLDFDPMAPDQRECPFDLYARARQEMPIFFSERFDLWIVTRHQDIVAI